jgi:hypothetical protein
VVRWFHRFRWVNLPRKIDDSIQNESREFVYDETAAIQEHAPYVLMAQAARTFTGTGTCSRCKRCGQ